MRILISPPKGARHKKKIVGRGMGSGHGKTSGRGHKGQKARAGGNVRPGFEGGQMPLIRRLPKRGFKNIFKKYYQILNLKKLAKYFKEGETVSKDTLFEKGLIKDKNIPVKILGDGSLDFKLSFIIDKFSKQAEEKIIKAGGAIIRSNV